MRKAALFPLPGSPLTRAKPPSPTWFSILQQKLSVAGVGKRELITLLVRRVFKVLFRPIEACVAGFVTKGFDGFAGLLSRKTDRWMMSDRESRAVPPDLIWDAWLGLRLACIVV